MKISLFFVTLSWIVVVSTAINSLPIGSRQAELLKKKSVSLPFQQDHIHHFRGGQDDSTEEGDGDDVETAVETIEEPSATNKKLSSLKERTMPAILMLAVVGGLTYYYEEKGLVLLTLLLQVGMYHEMTTVMGGKLQSFMKWWWFLAAAAAINGPRLFPVEAKDFATLSYSMIVFGLVQKICRLQVTGQDAAGFREFLRQTAVSALAVVSMNEVSFAHLDMPKLIMFHCGFSYYSSSLFFLHLSFYQL